MQHTSFKLNQLAVLGGFLLTMSLTTFLSITYLAPGSARGDSSLISTDSYAKGDQNERFSYSRQRRELLNAAAESRADRRKHHVAEEKIIPRSFAALQPVEMSRFILQSEIEDDLSDFLRVTKHADHQKKSSPVQTKQPPKPSTSNRMVVTRATQHHQRQAAVSQIARKASERTSQLGRKIVGMEQRRRNRQ